jgi:hypothetical protein
MRASTLPIALVVAALALCGCGGGGGGNDDDKTTANDRALKFEPPTEEGVSTAIRGYLNALNRGDGKRACRLLDDRGKASLIAFLSSNRPSIACEDAVRRVARRAVPVRRFKIERVSVTGRSATANVEGTDPPSSSAVTLANRGDGWKISYPPGLQAKTGKPPPGPVPGVPLEPE